MEKAKEGGVVDEVFPGNDDMKGAMERVCLSEVVMRPGIRKNYKFQEWQKD